VGSPVVLSVDPSTNGGSAVLELVSSVDLPRASLTALDFRSSTTGEALGSKITFSELGGAVAAQALPKSIKADEPWLVKVDVANVWEAGESVARLVEGAGREVGRLTAVKSRVPFAVRVEAPHPEKPEMWLRRGAKAFLTLKNDDPLSYRVSWILLDGETALRGTTVNLARNGAQAIELTPPDAWFSNGFGGLFKDEDRDGQLVLVHGSDADPQDGFAMRKIIPVKLHLRYWPGAWAQGFVGYLLLFLVLLSGGLASLFLSFALPNKLRQLQLQGRVRDLSNHISGISTNIDSRLRVLLRVERSKWFRQLDGSIFSPDTVDVLSECAEAIDALGRRIELAERLDDLRREYLDQLEKKLPPTHYGETGEELQAAADELRRAQTPTGDLLTAKALLDKAESLLATQGRRPTFSTDLVKRLTRLKGAFEPLKATKEWERMSRQLPGAFAVLEDPQSYDAAKILPEDVSRLDTAASKLEVVLDYVRLYQGTEAGKTYRRRLDDHEVRLLRHLHADAWGELGMARLIVREMGEDVFPEDLRFEIEHFPTSVSVEIDDSVVRQNLPVKLSVHFHRPAYQRAAARDEWVCNWAFPGDLHERWWSVWHYFQDAGDNTVTVTFEDAEGHPVVGADRQPLEVSATINVRRATKESAGKRYVVEGLRLAMAMFIAVVGLVAGAREQVLKLDLVPGLVAVFVIGFGADTLKNLITQTPATKH
jgi:hypothetical protein